MFRKPNFMVVLLIIIFLTASGQVWAGGEKERMRQRLPEIKALKAQGVVGENNLGLLTIRKETQQRKLIESENQDRQRIYQAIAKQQGTTPDRVGKRRAMAIAKKADPGTFVQDTNGQWRQK